MSISAATIKTSKVVSAVMVIVGALVYGYEKNAWAADVQDMSRSIRLDALEAEERQLTRQIRQWKAKPARSSIEQGYIDSTVDELKSDRTTVNKKIDKIN